MNTTAATATAEAEPTLWRAVVRPDQLTPRIVRETPAVPASLTTWVEQVWSLQWSDPLPGALSSVITHPTVQLTLEGGPPGEVRHGHVLPAALVHGVTTRRFAPDLPTGGWVVGVHLVPGAFRDLTGIPVWQWTDQVVPWSQVWSESLLAGCDLDAVWSAADPASRAAALIIVAEELCRGREPTADGRRARSVERLARVDRSIRTVADLAERVAMSVRSLQRLCRNHLGVTPGWLLRRARVIDAHELLTTTDLDVAEVAARLGWYDQAHLTRDYTQITGSAPVQLRRERAGSQPHVDGVGRSPG